MSYPEVRNNQVPTETKPDQILDLGVERFKEQVGHYSPERLRNSRDLHQAVLSKYTDLITYGTISALGSAAILASRIGYQNEIMHFIEWTAVILGATGGTIGVYGRSACVDAINIVTSRLHGSRT